MMYFCIFKAPPKGATHIFRKGEPFLSAILIPVEPDLELAPMNEAEAAERELKGRRLATSRDRLATGTRWLSSTDTVFDGTYRQLYRAARQRDRAG
jgi:hypothetical protein